MNRIPAVFFDENQLINYLKFYKFKFPRRRFPTNIEEVLFAIWTKRVFETKTDKNFLIAFELKDKLSKLMPSFNANLPKDVKTLLEKYVEKDTEIDFGLALKNKTNNNHEANIGFAFQLKIFDVHYDNPEKQLAEEINSCLYQKYSKLSRNVSLLIVPQLKSNIYLERTPNIKTIIKLVKPNKKSFEKIFILWRKKPTVCLAEIYPKRSVWFCSF